MLISAKQLLDALQNIPLVTILAYWDNSLTILGNQREFPVGFDLFVQQVEGEGEGSAVLIAITFNGKDYDAVVDYIFSAFETSPSVCITGRVSMLDLMQVFDDNAQGIASIDTSNQSVGFNKVQYNEKRIA